MIEEDRVATNDGTLAAARNEGARIAYRRYQRQLLAIVVGVFALLVTTTIAGVVLMQRAEAAAPEVIAEIAEERQAQLEERLDQRMEEAQVLGVQLFTFLESLWTKTEALQRVRNNVAGARTQLGLLTDEVDAALDSPTQHLGALLENGPTRAKVMVEHLLAVASELQRFIPAVLSALQQAQTAAEVEDESSMRAVLKSMDALLNPFLGNNIELQAEWANLKHALLGWLDRVDADFDDARAQLSGASLSEEFMSRMADRMF